MSSSKFIPVQDGARVLLIPEHLVTVITLNSGSIQYYSHPAAATITHGKIENRHLERLRKEFAPELGGDPA